MLEGVTEEEVKVAIARMERIAEKIEKMFDKLEKAPSNEDGSEKTIRIQAAKAPSGDEYEHQCVLKVLAAIKRRKQMEKEDCEKHRTE